MKKIYALTDCRTDRNIFESLEDHGFIPVHMPGFDRLSEPVSAHPDMLVLPIDDRLFTYRSYYEKNSELFSAFSHGRKIITCDDPTDSQYPYDIGLNAFICKGFLFSNTKHLAKNAAENVKYPKVSVKQGYAACSCVVLDDALITADKSIYDTATDRGIPALRISSGCVALPPYEYGFIGGACGVFENTVYFTGDVSRHPDFTAISDFLSRHGYSAICLTDSPLSDIGKIIFLSEIT